MRYIFLAILTMAFAFTSCYDDKGSYAYSDINEISVDTVGRQTEFEVYQFDTLRIEPAIRFALEEVADEDMDYKWTIFNNAFNNTTSEVIGTERILNTVIRQQSNATNYSLVLDAKNKRSGVAVQMTYTLYVTSSIISGVVVLHTNDTESDLDYIATPRAVPTITTTRRNRNAYFTANGAKIPGMPNFIGAVRVNNKQINSLYIGTREELYKVSGKTFELEYTSADMLPIMPANRNFQSYLSPGGTNTWQFLINDEQAHNIANQYDFEITFSQALAPNETLNAEAIELAPFIYTPAAFFSTTGFAAVFYDRLGQRFVMRPNSNYPVAKISPFDAQASSVFDVNNIGMDILFFERGYLNYGYAVFQEQTGAKWLYIADFNKKMDASIAVAKYDMSGLTGIADARFYSTGSRGNVFLYATESDIYSYDYTGSNQAVKINDPFGAGEVITGMKIYKPWATTNNLGEADGTLLYVATWDGQEGRLYEFSLNETNGYLRNKTPLEVFDGMGKIVDFCFKVQGTGTGS